MPEQISLTCPVTSKTFACLKADGVPYATATKEKAKPESIFFSPYSEIGIAYPPLKDDQLERIYTEGNYWQEPKETVFASKTSPGLYAMADARWQTIEPIIAPRLKDKDFRLLDVGAGHGYLGMVAAQSRAVVLKSYHVTEKDPVFQRSLQKTWQRRSPEVDFKVLDSLEGGRQAYDLIALSHILEHLNDPKALLKACTRLLKKDGHLFIDVPHQDFKFKGDVYPHVLFFTPNSLKQLVESVGLEVVHLKCYGKDMSRSPLNAHYTKDLSYLISNVLYRTRILWPESVLNSYYVDYFGAKLQNERGTWIRLMAREKEQA